MSRIAVINMTVVPELIDDTKDDRVVHISGKKVVDHTYDDVKKSLDKDLSNFKSGAWKTLNNIWHQPTNGKIIEREYLGKLKIKITVDITEKVRKHFIGNNNDTDTVLKSKIREYIKILGPDTWMQGNITYKKKFELIPIITNVVLHKNMPKGKKNKSNRRSKKRRSKKRKSKRRSKKRRSKKRRSKKRRSKKRRSKKRRSKKRKSKRRSKKRRSKKRRSKKRRSKKRKSKRRSKKRRSKKKAKAKSKGKKGNLDNYRRPKGRPKDKDKEMQKQAKYQNRPSPPYKANKYCGKTMEGNDGNMYKSVKNAKGICQWKKIN